MAWSIRNGVLFIIDHDASDLQSVLDEIKSDIGFLPLAIIYRDYYGWYRAITNNGIFKYFKPIAHGQRTIEEIT